MHTVTRLTQAIRSAASDADWLDQAFATLHASTDVLGELSLLCAMSRRKLGQRALGTALARLDSAAGPVHAAHWTAGDAARVALLLQAADSNPAGCATLVEAVYRQGDESERCAVLQGLALFPCAETLVGLAAEAARTNSTALFAALALANPYPARYFGDHAFNHLVLKALFMGLDIELIQGLAARANPELSRMCEDYVDERRAAGRAVPASLWLALAPHASERGERELFAQACAGDPEQRYYALRGVQRRPVSPPREALLNERRRLETDPRILALLEEDR